MNQTKMQELCSQLKLGEIQAVKQVFGGLLHEMYQVKTDLSTFAVKVLNPTIMKRDTAKNNYLFSEQVAKIAHANHLPVVLAIEKESCLHRLDGQYYMVFGWVNAKALLPHEATCYHCEKMGEILAKLHAINFSEIAQKPDTNSLLSNIDWNVYCGFDKVWATEFAKIKTQLFEWECKANESANIVLNHQVISHRDMDCKNILWDKNNNPIIIDWEAAGYVNPLQELLDVAIAWSGLEIGQFSGDKLEAVIKSYVFHGGAIKDDVNAVLNFTFKNKLEWLVYNLNRSLGFEATSKAEQTIGTDEVVKTIKALQNYEKHIPMCKAILEKHNQ